MKSTEIFVEQVLIGLLVLATGYLPYCNTGKIKELFESKSIVEGAGIVAIAYLLGIVFDRLQTLFFHDWNNTIGLNIQSI